MPFPVFEAEGHARPGAAQASTDGGWQARAAVLAEQFAANAARHDRDDSFVADNYATLKQQGFFKAHVPQELGGGGATYREICGIIRTLAQGCGSTALAFSMHTHPVALAVWRLQNENAPTQGLLRRIAAEDLVMLTSGGSDWLTGTGKAVRVDGGYRISGRKIFASGSPAGDLMMTGAVFDDPEAGPTVLHFGLPMKADGVRILDTWRVMGMRGTASNDVELDQVFIPDAAISGRRPQGKWHPLFHMISMLAFPIVYSAYLGVAEGARAIALDRARRRAGDETMAYQVGEMENEFATAEMAVAGMIGIAQTHKPSPETTNAIFIRRTLAAQAAIRTVECAMEVAGGAALYREIGIERAFRDVQGARYHALREKAQLRFTGRMALGLDIDG